MPHIVAPLSFFELEITYTPSAAGYAAAGLEVSSNDPVRPLVTVELSGGVAPTIEDVLAEFDASVADGSLVGSGPGGSADGRLGALRNMIAAAAAYLDQGEDALAVAQLEAVLERCDGYPLPPDFVAGTAAVDLHDLVQKVIAAP